MNSKQRRAKYRKAGNKPRTYTVFITGGPNFISRSTSDRNGRTTTEVYTRTQ